MCRRPVKVLNPKLDRYECGICGEYHMVWKAGAIIADLPLDDRRLAALSAYVRDANKLGETPTLTTQNWVGAAESYVHASVGTKLRRVLELAGQRTPAMGASVRIYPGDYPRFFAQPSEVQYLVRTLVERKLLSDVTGADDLCVTAEGWEQLEPSSGGGIPGTCFVAMSFKDEMKPAYDSGIHPALTDCGFEVTQLSRVEHAENINDKIIAEIRRAQFLVADFTHHAAGVYFEAGFGLGLGKLVVWTCRSDQFNPDKVHFDTRPYNHIVWVDEADLRERLKNRVRALVANAKRD